MAILYFNVHVHRTMYTRHSPFDALRIEKNASFSPATSDQLLMQMVCIIARKFRPINNKRIKKHKRNLQLLSV